VVAVKSIAIQRQVSGLHWGNESIALPWNCLDVTRGFSVIAKGFAKALRGVVYAFIEFDVGVGRLEALLKFFPGNKLPWFFEKNKQHSKRPVLKSDADAMLP
jgi:hypothetical protein